MIALESALGTVLLNKVRIHENLQIWKTEVDFYFTETIVDLEYLKRYILN